MIINNDQINFSVLFPEVVDNNNRKILDLWNSYRVMVDPKEFEIDAFIEYQVKSSDSFPLLAYKFYGNVKLWWLIPLVNDVEDPFDFIQDAIDESKTIKILKNDQISNIIFKMSRMKANSK